VNTRRFELDRTRLGLSLKPLKLAAIAALAVATTAMGGGCTGGSRPATSVAEKRSMPTSAAAAAVVERAQHFRSSASGTKFPTLLPMPGRGPAVAPTVAVSEAIGAKISGAIVRADFTKGSRRAEVASPAHADGAREVQHVSSGARITVGLHGASNADAEYASGYVVYRGALTAGGDLVHRPSRHGFEDYFLFDKKPSVAHVEYDLSLPPVVAGLRLTRGVLELLNARGTPLFHVAPPFLVDAVGNTTKASLSVAGCAVDQSSQPPWGRVVRAS